MATRRCRSCLVFAPGGEVPVLYPSNAWSHWHVCGRCWGLLVLGLQSHSGYRSLNPFAEIRRLRLRPDDVHSAIREGLVFVGTYGAQVLAEREEVLKQEQRLRADLTALSREVEESAEHGLPRETWQELRLQIRQLRLKLRELRQRYPGVPPAQDDEK